MRNTKNQDIRDFARANKIYFWQICEKLGISEPTMTRKLRHELAEDEKAQILGIIAELAAEGA